MGDLGPHQAGAVLRRGEFGAAARIEDGHHKRFQLLLDALGESGIEDFSGDVEGQFSPGWIRLYLRWL